MTSPTQSRPSQPAAQPIRVLIVDDSALVRRSSPRSSRADRDIEVVGAASDAHMAREKIKALNPDVLTLDVEMPKMDGVTFLRNLMRLRPMPVVMVSSLTERGADVTLDALALGAVDYLSKPKIDLAATLKDYGESSSRRSRWPPARACARSTRSAPLPRPRAELQRRCRASRQARRRSTLRTTDRIIAIGASTGGTEAIKEVLMGLPPDAPGVVIAQHIPKAFSAPFAQAHGRVLPDDGVRGAGRPADPARPRLHRAGRPAPAGRARRRALRAAGSMTARR